MPYKNVLIYGAVALAFVAYSVFLWRTSQHVQEAEFLRKANADLTAAISKADGIGKQLADAEAKLKPQQITITKEVTREVEKPVYRDCHTTPDGVRLIEQAIDSFPSTHQ